MNIYKGHFENDTLCGSGEMTYVAGHRYIGNWANNKKNGFGVFYYLGGHKYEGEWKGNNIMVLPPLHYLFFMIIS